MKKSMTREIQYAVGSKSFIEKLKSAMATVCKIDNRNEIIKEVHRYTLENQANKTITVADVKNQASQDWKNPDISMQYESQTISTSVTFASIGIEETGTLVILPATKTQTGMNFLPEHHIVVLDTKNIVQSMEDAWQILCSSGRELPRIINLVTGAASSTDTEYSNQAGTHGPKYLHVILIESKQQQ